MKNFFILCFFTFSMASIQAQINNRVMVKGQIIINNDDAEPSGIEVFNMTSSQGTTTDRNGKFILPMAINDQVQVSSVQFQTVNIKVTKGVIDNQKLTVTIDEGTGVNELEEVVVKPYNLSGDVRADVAKINTEEIATVEESSEELVEDPKRGYTDDDYSRVENVAMEDNTLRNGLNFANIFRAIFKNEHQKDLSSKEMTARLEKAFNDDFFKRYLDLEEGEIPDFIYYVEHHGLKDEMLKKTNELDFIQFLINKSREFKEQE